MKRIIIIMLTILTAMCICSCKGKKETAAADTSLRIAVMTVSKVFDGSYNQIGYETAADFAKAHNCVCKPFLVQSLNSDDIASIFNEAASQHYNVFILMGYNFIRALILNALKYKNVKFVGVDINDFDIYTMAQSIGLMGYKIPQNVYCGSYHEEISGFLAGYAAVKEGFTHLGFVGGKPVPAVVRYGLGYVQGIDCAAAELGISRDVIVDYVYSKSFEANRNITVAIKDWCEDGLQVVFPCGGAIWSSVCLAASEYDVRVIGVDTDQSTFINNVKPGMYLTSAVKNIGGLVKYALDRIEDGRFDEELGGKSDTMGITSADDLDMNFTQLPTDNWYMTKFTKEDYADLIRRIYEGQIKISGSVDDKHEFKVDLRVQPNIK